MLQSTLSFMKSNEIYNKLKYKDLITYSFYALWTAHNTIEGISIDSFQEGQGKNYFVTKTILHHRNTQTEIQQSFKGKAILF